MLQKFNILLIFSKKGQCDLVLREVIQSGLMHACIKFERPEGNRS